MENFQCRWHCLKMLPRLLCKLAYCMHFSALLAKMRKINNPRFKKNLAVVYFIRRFLCQISQS
ncbi:hypothetical protein DYQ05_03875 [Treponema pedis]|nr:hypothetical protein DYQ05_03875 [Treponema pedis]